MQFSGRFGVKKNLIFGNSNESDPLPSPLRARTPFGDRPGNRPLAILPQAGVDRDVKVMSQ